MRAFAILAVFALICAPAIAGPKAAEPETVRMPAHEPDTYRFGSPYNTSRGTSPGACEAMCTRDASCGSWSLVPATFRMGPRCELKRNIGARQHRPGAVSGVAVRFQPRAKPVHPISRRPTPPTVKPTPIPVRVAPPSAVPYRATPRPVQIRPAPRGPQRPIIYTPPQRRSSQNSDLMGAPATRPDAVTRATPKRAPVVVSTVARPAPVPSPAVRPQPAPFVDAVTRPGPPLPTRPVPQFEMRPKPAPNPMPAPTPAPQNQSGIQIYPPPPPIKPRKPWTERGPDDVDYSVQGMDYLPGDEEATAGYVDGVPDE